MDQYRNYKVLRAKIQDDYFQKSKIILQQYFTETFGPGANNISIINFLKYQLGLELTVNDLDIIRCMKKVVEGYSINTFVKVHDLVLLHVNRDDLDWNIKY